MSPRQAIPVESAGSGSALPRGFYLLLTAQFASALADNALLIVTMALLHRRGLPGWWAPVMKLGFNAMYVVTAPWVGALADSLPKAHLMAWMNGVKVLGVLALLSGLHPVAAFVLVGLGAAAYAPAKYGLVTELVGPGRLVEANGWLEVSIVCAALLGVVLGGLLVSPSWLSAVSTGAAWVGGNWAGGGLAASLCVLLGIYGLAAALNVGIRDSGARYPAADFDVPALVRDFRSANRTLWNDRDGGLSLAVTTIFWGVGATLQFVVLRWAESELQLPLSQASYLQAAVAVGVIAGAAAAGRWVALAHAKRMMGIGIVLGLLMPVVASTTHVEVAVPLLVLVGMVGGLMVVPLNALLQHRGHVLLSAGRSIAVQGFNENASILAMLAVYALMIWLDVPIVTLMTGFGLLIAAAVAALTWRELQRTRR